MKKVGKIQRNSLTAPDYSALSSKRHFRPSEDKYFFALTRTSQNVYPFEILADPA